MSSGHFNQHWWTPPPRNLAGLDALIIDARGDLDGTVCKVLHAAEESFWIVRAATGVELAFEEKRFISVNSELPAASARASGGQAWASGAQAWASGNGGAQAWASGCGAQAGASGGDAQAWASNHGAAWEGESFPESPGRSSRGGCVAALSVLEGSPEGRNDDLHAYAQHRSHGSRQARLQHQVLDGATVQLCEIVRGCERLVVTKYGKVRRNSAGDGKMSCLPLRLEGSRCTVVWGQEAMEEDAEGYSASPYATAQALLEDNAEHETELGEDVFEWRKGAPWISSRTSP